MEVRKEDFPVVVQAFETTGNSDVFIAEQVVNSQAETNAFTARYTGKLIKARRLTEIELGKKSNHQNTAVNTDKKSPVGTYILIVVLLIIVALVIIGFTTGWIQRTFNINL